MVGLIQSIQYSFIKKILKPFYTVITYITVTNSLSIFNCKMEAAVNVATDAVYNGFILIQLYVHTY